MGKTRILKKRVASSPKQEIGLKLTDFDKVQRVHPINELADPDQTAKAVFECLMDNDPQGAMEMIEMYLDAVNKASLMRETKLPKSTMYSAFRHRNPTLRTLAKIMSSAGH
jgi:DNA-binding phage protein